jgi:hypothetical protein
MYAYIYIVLIAYLIHIIYICIAQDELIVYIIQQQTAQLMKLQQMLSSVTEQLRKCIFRLFNNSLNAEFRYKKIQ